MLSKFIYFCYKISHSMKDEIFFHLLKNIE